jgi:hypothetical protein
MQVGGFRRQGKGLRSLIDCHPTKGDRPRFRAIGSQPMNATTVVRTRKLREDGSEGRKRDFLSAIEKLIRDKGKSKSSVNDLVVVLWAL